MRIKVLIVILLFNSAIIRGQLNYGYIDYTKAYQEMPNYFLNQNKYVLIEQNILDSANIYSKEFHDFWLSCHYYINFCDSITKQKFYKKVEFYQNNPPYIVFQKLSEELDSIKNVDEIELKAIFNNEVNLFCEKFKISILVKQEGVYLGPDCKDYTNELITFIRRNYN